MSNVLTAAVIVLIASLPLTGQAAAKKKEARARAGIATKCLDLARRAIDAGAKGTATRALDWAKTYGAEDADVEALREKANALPKEDAAAKPTFKAAPFLRKIAGDLQRVAKTKASGPLRAHFDDYYWQSVVVDPTPQRRKGIAKMIAGCAKKNADRARRLLSQAKHHDPDGVKAGAYRKIEAKLGKRDYLIVNAVGHPLQAIVLLPKKWSHKKTWRAVVYVDGARSDFLEAATNYRPIIDREGYVLIVPMTLSNANDLDFSDYPYEQKTLETYKSYHTRMKRLAWDVAGLDSIFQQVKMAYSTEDRFFWTAWSGGGFLTYWWLHHRPETVRAAAPASTNYDASLGRDAKPKGDARPAVRIFTGSTDSAGPPRIFPQSDEAVKNLKAAGFKDIERVHIQGRGHDRFESEVFDFFKKIR